MCVQILNEIIKTCTNRKVMRFVNKDFAVSENTSRSALRVFKRALKYFSRTFLNRAFDEYMKYFVRKTYASKLCVKTAT